MKKLHLAFVAPIAVLAACSSGADSDGDGEISAEEAEAAVDVSLTPGLWESTAEITELDVPGMPDEVRQMMMQAETSNRCISPEEAENPTPEMFQGNEDSGCSFSEFQFSGGRMHMVATCEDPNSDEGGTMTMDGSYTPTSMDMAFSMEGTGPGGQQIRIAGNRTARRTGDCEG